MKYRNARTGDVGHMLCAVLVLSAMHPLGRTVAAQRVSRPSVELAVGISELAGPRLSDDVLFVGDLGSSVSFRVTTRVALDVSAAGEVFNSLTDDKVALVGNGVTQFESAPGGFLGVLGFAGAHANLPFVRVRALGGGGYFGALGSRGPAGSRAAAGRVELILFPTARLSLLVRGQRLVLPDYGGQRVAGGGMMAGLYMR